MAASSRRGQVVEPVFLLPQLQAPIPQQQAQAHLEMPDEGQQQEQQEQQEQSQPSQQAQADTHQQMQPQSQQQMEGNIQQQAQTQAQLQQDVAAQAPHTCPVSECQVADFQDMQAYGAHLQSHSVRDQRALACKIRAMPQAFRHHPRMCVKCGEIVSNTSSHGSSCGDDIVWDPSKGPYEVFEELQPAEMVAARSKNISRQLNRAAETVVTMLFEKLTHQIFNLRTGSARAKGLCNMWFLFEAMILNTDRRGSTSEIVLSRCRKLASNDPALWRELRDPVLSVKRVLPSPQDRPGALRERAHNKADEKARLGQIREVGTIVYGDLTGFPTRSSLNDGKLRDKFASLPGSDHLAFDLPPGDELLLPSVEQVLQALEKMAPGKAQGPFGNTSENLKRLPPYQLHALVCLFFTDTAHPYFRELATSRFAIGIKKANNDVRPISISTPLVKLVSSTWKASALASTVQEKYGNSAKAIGDPASVEVIYNTVNTALLEDEETVAITVDISNCFNSTSRVQIVQELIKHNMQAELGVAKSMLGYSNSVYHVNHNSQPQLLCHNNDGIHQGDPASPACLTLVLASALTPLRKKVEAQGGLQMSLMDDVTYVVKLREAEMVLRALPAALAQKGFKVNLDKTQIYNVDGRVEGAQQLAAQHGIGYTEEGIVLLGVPLAKQVQYVHDRLDVSLADLYTKANRVKEYAWSANGRRQQYRPQVALRLLRQSFNSKWNHHARCLPPAIMKGHAERFDTLVEDTAFALVFGPKRKAGPAYSIQHMRLATEEGGLGLKSLTANLEVTYLSAWNDTMREAVECRLPPAALAFMQADNLSRHEGAFRLQSTMSKVKDNLKELEVRRRELNGNNDLVEAEARSQQHNCPVRVAHLGHSDRKLQQRMTRKMDRLRYYQLIQHIKQSRPLENTRDYLLAKMCELKAPGTGNWLKALPTSSRFSIPRDEFRTVMAIHMLLPHPLIMNLLGLRKEQWHGCLCQLGGDRLLSEDHMAGCNSGGHIIKRHDDVVMQLTEVARHLGTAVIREPRGLLRGYGQGGPDLMFRPANSNRKIVIDVAVASSVQGRNLERQAKPLVKAKAAADRKWRENHFRMPRHCDFKAVTFQATGGMSAQAQQMLKRLPQERLPEHLRVETHYETCDYRSFYTVAVAVAIARGTAENFLELAYRIKRNKPGGVLQE